MSPPQTLHDHHLHLAQRRAGGIQALGPDLPGDLPQLLRVIGSQSPHHLTTVERAPEERIPCLFQALSRFLMAFPPIHGLAVIHFDFVLRGITAFIMSTLIALFGPQQVGKSTSARSLSNFHQFEIVSFADPIYRAIGAILGMNLVEVKALPKETPMPELGGRTLRYALQTLGTEWGRNLISEELWILTAQRRIQSLLSVGRPVVVDDLRFDNERRILADMGCKFVRLTREGIEESGGHGSEVHWKSFTPDATVENPAADDATYWSRAAGRAILQALQESQAQS